MGPDNWHRISAGTLAWAHRSAQKLMPVLLCGPMQLLNKICKWCCMGPESCPKDVQVLLCEPRQMVKNFCRYLCMGPQNCPETDASVPVWAQETTKRDLPVVLCGPTELLKKCAVAPVPRQPAQAATKHDLRVALYRPRELPKRCAGAPVWAQTTDKDLLPVYLRGPTYLPRK